jgi:hypothetical protein
MLEIIESIKSINKDIFTNFDFFEKKEKEKQIEMNGKE